MSESEPNLPPFQSAAEAFQWIQSFYNAEKSGVYDSRVYRLDRMAALLKAFGNPQKMVPSIHIAGSKGKGSTATYLSSILTHCGFKTGLYTSPHLYDYRERITLNGEFFPEELYIQAISEIRDRLPNIMRSVDELRENPPTVFELITLAAFIIFALARCEFIVVETGLGGRLDATNCITPLLSIITRIEKEHTEYLGTELWQIATEKGGIIKPNNRILTAHQFPVVTKTLKSIAQKQNAQFLELKKFVNVKFNKHHPYEFKLKFKNGEVYTITTPAPGHFQGTNAATAIVATLFILKQIASMPHAPRIPEGTSNLKAIFTKAIQEAPLKGRMEKLPGSPSIYIDGAHTPLSFKHAVTTFNELEGKKGILIFAAVDGKDHKKLIKQIKGNFSHVIVTQAGTFRKNSPKELFAKVQKKNPKAELIINTQKALQTAIQLAAENSKRGKSQAILCAGSFFLVAEIGRPNLSTPQ